MIDINVTRRGPRRAIIRTLPSPACARACIIGYDIGAIALEYSFARVARAGLRDPVREQVARVAGLRALGGDGEAGELGARFAGRRHVGRGACGEVEGCWGGGNDGYKAEEDGGLHGRWCWKRSRDGSEVCEESNHGPGPGVEDWRKSLTCSLVVGDIS